MVRSSSPVVSSTRVDVAAIGAQVLELQEVFGMLDSGCEARESVLAQSTPWSSSGWPSPRRTRHTHGFALRCSPS
jgi:hypothetical protein